MNEVIEMESAPVATPKTAVATTTPSDLLRLAVEQGADMEKLEKLMALQERWEANQARKSYVEAMADFKQHAPEIFKDKNVAFTGTTYNHATLGGICEVVIAALAKHGISHRWDIKQPSGMIVVSCILTHKLGHSEATQLEAPPDNSGKKNGIQQIASTVTYLQRYTLLAACGLATKDMPDDDGQGAEQPKREPVKSTINGRRFADGLEAIAAGTYTAEKMRSNFILTLDQETALADIEQVKA